MIIQLDVREKELLLQVNSLISIVPLFKDIKIESQSLPIGDIIIFDEENQEMKLVIERKSVNDLLASIKDGRYEEQSYRLNGLNHHNHNIIYLVEGDINKMNRFKDNKSEKLTMYSAIFSLNYYKGFSVIRTFSLEESAIFICNSLIKLTKERSNKKAFYNNNNNLIKIVNQEEVKNDCAKNDCAKNDCAKNDCAKNDCAKNGCKKNDDCIEIEECNNKLSDKDYVSVVKKVKKENITPDNIGEIMLCQIPGISSVTALSIMDKFKTLPNLLKELEKDDNCLKDISNTNVKGQTRKINKSCAANIIKYLLKK
jgi:ERCC4-type nuclease